MNKGDGSRFMIPASVRRTIQNIREIAGNHSDEEVYTMLKECAMDPNEAAQKLLLQDTFHEVKRKRDKKKENMREHANPGWRPGSLGRGKRGGRQNHYSHNLSNDGDGRNLNSRKENAVNQGLNKGVHNAIGTEKKPTTSISSTVPDISNPLSKADILLSSQGCSSQVSDDDGITSSEGTYSYNKDHVSAAEFVIPSLDAHNPGKMATIKHVIQSQETVIEMTVNNVSSHDVVDPEFSSLRDKGSTEVDSSYGEIQVKLEGFETNKVSFTSQVPYSSSYRVPTVNRSLSTHDNHSPQLVGSQEEVVSNKEWKPKSINMSSTQASGIFGHSNVPMMGDTVSQSITVPPSCLVDSEETTWKIEKKLDKLKLPTRQHVFIPTHLQVPDYERYGLSFGSFDASFNFNMALANDHASDVSTAQLSGSTNHIEENVEQPSSCASSAAEEADDSDYIHSPIQIPETYSSREAEISSISTMEEHDQTKQDPILALDPKDSVVPSVPSNSTVGLVPQVPQIHSAPSEVSGSFVVSTAGPTVATQMVVAMQGPALLQQPVPIFQQPAGVHLPHYPIPYSQYYSPFCAPPTVHPFPSNATFPQQPPIGSMYPLGGAAAAAPVRFSQYKSGTNVGNSPPFGMPMAYAAYNSVPTGYTPIVSSSESTGNQDLNSSQFKENNIYRSEQQSEGSGLWIPAAGQDISGLQAGSFCGIPPQRQYMSFAPAQSHGAFSPIYHSSPAMPAAALHPFFQQSQSATGATEMGSPPAGICQQTQHAQINWNNNY